MTTVRLAQITAEERLVFLALAHTLDLGRQSRVEAYAVARRTAFEQLRSWNGKRRPAYGEARTRKLLARLVEHGLVSRRRHWDTGHLFSITPEGRIWLAAEGEATS